MNLSIGMYVISFYNKNKYVMARRWRKIGSERESKNVSCSGRLNDGTDSDPEVLREQVSYLNKCQIK